jgi:hypothetical protein
MCIIYLTLNHYCIANTDFYLHKIAKNIKIIQLIVFFDISHSFASVTDHLIAFIYPVFLQ